MYSINKPQSKTLKQLMDTAHQLQIYNEAIANALNNPALACWVAKILPPEITLLTPSAHSLTWLKYQEGIILDTLNQLNPRLKLEQLKIQVSPSLNYVAEVQTPKTPCLRTAPAHLPLECLKQTAKHIQDPSLSQALTQLAKTLDGLPRS